MKREFPHGFDLGRSPHALKSALGVCVFLAASNQTWPVAEPPPAASARVADLLDAIARHADYQRLRADLMFIAEARAAVGTLRFRRTECAVCARLKSGLPFAERAVGDAEF